MFKLANSEGLHVLDFRPYQHLSVLSVAEAQGIKERGFSTLGVHKKNASFLEKDLSNLAHQASEQAINNLGAEQAPSGVFPVIINNGFGGVIFHEACGHGLETTSVAEKISCFF